MASEKAECTILIPVRNDAAKLRVCLQSVLLGSVVPEIIVLDNGSTDETGTVLEQEFPGVRHVQIGANTGRCHAINTGIHMTKTPYCMTLSPHIRVGKHTVERLIIAAERHPNAYGIQARVMDSENNGVLLSSGIELDAMGKISHRGSGKNFLSRRVRKKYGASAKVLAVGLEASLFRMDRLTGIGIFDERLYGTAEDLDLGIRAALDGLYGLSEPGAVVRGDRSLYEVSDFYKKVQIGNIVYILYKNMPSFQYRLNAPLIRSSVGAIQTRAAHALCMDVEELQSSVLRGKEMCMNAELEKWEAEQGASVTKRPLPEEFCMDVTDERVRNVYPLYLGEKIQGDPGKILQYVRLQCRFWRISAI